MSDVCSRAARPPLRSSMRTAAVSGVAGRAMQWTGSRARSLGVAATRAAARVRTNLLSRRTPSCGRHPRAADGDAHMRPACLVHLHHRHRASGSGLMSRHMRPRALSRRVARRLAPRLATPVSAIAQLQGRADGLEGGGARRCRCRACGRTRTVPPPGRCAAAVRARPRARCMRCPAAASQCTGRSKNAHHRKGFDWGIE